MPGMPRRTRFSTGGYVFHVLNRAAGRQTIFSQESDFFAFEQTLQQALRQVPTRLLCYCLMPSHWHLVLWPREDGELSAYLHWLTVTHTQRWHAFHGTTGTGPLYQGRFKSFPVETDDHFFTVCRYVERNALRANLVGRGVVALVQLVAMAKRALRRATARLAPGSATPVAGGTSIVPRRRRSCKPCEARSCGEAHSVRRTGRSKWPRNSDWSTR